MFGSLKYQSCFGDTFWIFCFWRVYKKPVKNIVSPLASLMGQDFGYKVLV